MALLAAIEVEVELVIQHSRHLRNIVAKHFELPGLNFRVTSDSTIGGCPIEALDIPPRIISPNGEPRYDLLNFRLKTKLYHFEKRTRQIGRGTAPVRYLICQKIEDAVPLQRIYLSQTLFELVLDCSNFHRGQKVLVEKLLLVE